MLKKITEKAKITLIAYWQVFKDGSWLKSPIFWARFLAYAIPLAFLLYVLYWNFLPFGYNKTFIINVGAKGDTDSSKEFYLEPSRDLGDASATPDGTTFRTLNGTAYAVFKPNAVLRDAEVTISVDGDGLSIIPPVINFDPNSVKWDYSWDFSTSTPKDLVGNAFHFDDGEYFDGKSNLELPNSSDKFESGPFTVYVEWTPENNTQDFQEIVGHYNWELLQNKNSVSFQVGRMNNSNGPFYSIIYPTTPVFFKQKHTALASYNPAILDLNNGYIDLFIDNTFVGRTYIGKDKIWSKYNGDRNLTIGKADHGAAKYFNGNIYNINLLMKNVFRIKSPIVEHNILLSELRFSIISTGDVKFEKISLNVKK